MLTSKSCARSAIRSLFCLPMVTSTHRSKRFSRLVTKLSTLVRESIGELLRLWPSPLLSMKVTMFVSVDRTSKEVPSHTDTLMCSIRTVTVSMCPSMRSPRRTVLALSLHQTLTCLSMPCLVTRLVTLNLTHNRSSFGKPSSVISQTEPKS